MSSKSHPPVGIMVAPNGARLTTSDHPAIPITTRQAVSTVSQCVAAGAAAVHLHVRDEQQKHVLDAARYQQSISALAETLGPDFPVQITTEAVGIYTQAEQIQLVQDVKPEFVSVALGEIAGAEDQLTQAEKFYHWADREHIAIQHILYSADDLTRFFQLKERGVVPVSQWSVLFVLGRYTAGQQSDPEALSPFLSVLKSHRAEQKARWMICAFGSNETACLGKAAAAGGHIRVGFENNRHNEDGSVAVSNEERVEHVVAHLAKQDQSPCDFSAIRVLLGEC